MEIAEKRSCANCKQEFPIFADDLAFHERMQVPPPTWCPDCRAKRRMVFWNQHNLFRKKEALENKEIFSTFPDSSPLKIYDRDYWWSDAWDPMDYGKDFDPGRPFLAQLRELLYQVPYSARSILNLVRSDYCDQAADFKDCYLCFNGIHAEDCMYGVNFMDMRSSTDFYLTNSCEFCYEIFSVEKSYQCLFVTEAEECRNCWFLQDCENCSDCFGCVGLSNKQYYIWNEPYNREAYQKKLEEFGLGSHRALSELKKRFDEFRLRFPAKYAHALNNKNVVGEYVYNSKDIYHCYEVLGGEHLAYCQGVADNVKDSHDFTNFGGNSELIYESVVSGINSRNLKFCVECWGGSFDLEYCINCPSSSNCFGCVGLRKKQYCILNKQYTREDYESLLPKLKEHMTSMPYSDSRDRVYAYGEFLPPEFSPLAYNESSAQDYYPLTEEQARKDGHLWRPLEEKEFSVTMETEDLPDHIQDVKDDVLKEIIRCSDCRRAYRIIQPELDFYRRLGLPLPRKCHRCRFVDRLKNQNPLNWRPAKCMCAGEKSRPQKGTDYEYKNFTRHFHDSEPCSNEFETAYAPDRPEILYCEKCYQSEVA